MGTVIKTGSITAHPTSYDTTHYSYASINTSYPISNAYTDSSSTSYAQVNWKTGSNAETYVYMKFDFSAIPADATITSVTASAKGYVNTTTSSRVTSRTMQLASGTTLKGSALTISTSTTAQTFTSVGSWTRAELQDAGVRFYVQRGTSNTTSSYQLRIYGATMTVNYSYPETAYDITVQNSTSANVTVSASEVLSGEDVAIAADTLEGITIKDNGTDITDQFVHLSGGTITAVPGTSFTTGFSQSGANFYQSSSTTSTSWLQYAIGHSAESPYSTSNTSNTYVKPEGQTGWINYQFDFSEIPLSATITNVSVKVYGARENATVDTSHVARFQCYSGSTAKGAIQNFTSTSNSAVTVSNVGTWTPEELHDAQLRFEIGYYGGRMLGITWTVVYDVSGYEYVITAVAANHTIVVTSSSAASDTIWVKLPSGGGDTLVNSVYVSERANGDILTTDLSGFAVGDLCKVVGTLILINGGVSNDETEEDIAHQFIWTGESYAYTVGIYTITITASSIKINKASGSPSGYIYAFSSQGDRYIRFYKSSGGGWTPAVKVYKKVNGSWVEQSDLTQVFDANTNYVKG